MRINYLDLFSGIGGFPLGLSMAGIEFNNHYFSEIDPYAIKVYRKHFPNAVELGDVTKIDGRTLPGIDLITGGFPCQDISVAGKQKGIDGGIRSGLFYQIIRIARDCHPRIIFLENVSNLLSINGGSDFGTVLRELASIGYDTEWHCVPASHVGAPHRRDRIWIVAYSHNTGDRTPRSKADEQWTQGGKKWEHSQLESCGHDKDVAYPRCKHGERNTEGVETDTPKRADGKLYAESSRKGQDVAATKCQGLERREKTLRPQERRNSDAGHNRENIGGEWRNRQWIVEPNVGRVANGVQYRVDRLKCLGNAVVPQVVAYLTELLVKPLLCQTKEIK